MARRKPHEFMENFSALARCLRAVAAEKYATFEVGSAQAKFLRYMDRHSRISQAELARATGTAPTLTGRALATLIERGWIRRKRSEADRRQYVLELTAAGQRARERVEAARGEVIARIEAVLDERDLADFARIAQKIIAALPSPGDTSSKP